MTEQEISNLKRGDLIQFNETLVCIIVNISDNLFYTYPLGGDAISHGLYIWNKHQLTHSCNCEVYLKASDN